MFKDLSTLIHAAMIIIAVAFLIVGFKLTLVGQAITIALCYATLYVFDFKDKKEILMAMATFIFLGNILYVAYDSINFSAVFEYIKANFNLTLVR